MTTPEQPKPTSPEYKFRLPDEKYVSIDLAQATPEQLARFTEAVADALGDKPYEEHEFKPPRLHNNFTDRITRRNVRRNRATGCSEQDLYGLSGTNLYLEEAVSGVRVRPHILRPFGEPTFERSRYELRYGYWWSEQVTAGGSSVSFHFTDGDVRITGGGPSWMMEQLGFTDDQDDFDTLNEIIDFLAAKRRGEPLVTSIPALERLGHDNA